MSVIQVLGPDYHAYNIILTEIGHLRRMNVFTFCGRYLELPYFVYVAIILISLLFYAMSSKKSQCLSIRATHIYVNQLTIIGSDYGLTPDGYQAIIWTNYWNIVNWALRNKFELYFNHNSYIFIQESALVNVACELATILPRPRCVKVLRFGINLIHKGQVVSTLH